VDKIQLPYTRTFINTGEPIKERDLVEFRLLYEGTVPSTGNTNKPADVHAIRRVFHPQLRSLWSVLPQLRELSESLGREQYIEAINTKTIQPDPEDFTRKAFQIMGRNWSRGGYECVPLVTEDLSLRCALDILLLRPGEKKYIFEQGDIDGQVKTLFDALKIPKNLNEAGGSPPQADETPFFCLLEDDKLITEVRVVSDQLLLLPKAKILEANDCFAVVTVKINYKSPTTFDNWFG